MPEPKPQSRQSFSRWLPLALLLALHFVTRWALVGTPFLAQADYDESITGLMALNLLKGQWQIFFWGQPYMGTLEPTLAGLVFWLAGPSTAALRFTLVLVSSLGLLAVYALGCEVKDRRLGLLAAAFWALPPVFLTFDGLYATGGHLEAVVASAWFLYGMCRLAFRPPTRPALWAVAVGLVAGLGWWCSLLVAPLLLAAGLGLLVARPRLLKGSQPWLVLAGFLLGSGPFWWWNLTHDFMTFQAIEHGSRDILGNLLFLAQGVWLPTLQGAWWDSHSVESLIPQWVRWAEGMAIYLPVLLITMGVAVRWLYRLARRQAPLQQPLDMVVAVLLAGMLAHAASAYGHRPYTRYAQSIFVALAVLTGYWLCLAFAWRKGALPVLLSVLMGFNLLTTALFVHETAKESRRPVDAVIAKLRQLGIDRCYSPGRIGYPITFESREEIIAADNYGWRNYDYLNKVDQAARVAFITHDMLGPPFPGQMKLGLRMLGGGSQRDTVGEYTFWYDFRLPPPDRPLVCQDCRVTSSQGEPALERLLGGRDQLGTGTRLWRAGDWLEVDLGRQVDLARVSLLPLPEGNLRPGQGVPLLVEASPDGRDWQPVARGTCLAGLLWQGGHPKLCDSTAMEVAFSPRRARYVRLTLGQMEGQDSGWSLARLFLYEADPGQGYQPPAQARQSLAQAQDLLAAWSQDPTGPHPNFPGVPLDYRQRQVDWPRAIELLKAASLAAPEWEEPQRLLLEASLKSVIR